MQKCIIATLLGLFTTYLTWAQPAYAPFVQKEKLGRGMVLLREGDSLIVSWRLLEGEEKVPFNIYNDGKRLNEQNIRGVSFFKTIAPTASTEITLSAIIGEREFIYTQTYRPDRKDYIPIRLCKPENGVTPDGQRYTYSANDASVGDVDGDGSVTSADALMVLRVSVGLDTINGSSYDPRFDVDGDDSVTSADALKILRVSVGLETF